MPVVGFLGAPSSAPYARYVAAVHQGLKEVGYIEGQNVRFEYRWAEGHYDRLPVLATELIDRHHAAVIVPIGGAPATVAAKAVTSIVPIVFNMTADPVELGLVASLNRPGGNVTGIAMMGVELEAKRLELLRELVPGSTLIAMLVNPSNEQSKTQSREVQKAARAIGQQVLILSASTEQEIETAFAAFLRASRWAPRWRRYVLHEPASHVRRADGTSRDPCYLPMEVARRCRRSDELRSQLARCLSADRGLRRPGAQGRESGRPANPSVDQIRAGDQSQDC